MIYILIITQPPMAGTRNNGVSACLIVEREDLEETEQRDTCVTLPGAPSVLW